MYGGLGLAELAERKCTQRAKMVIALLTECKSEDQDLNDRMKLKVITNVWIVDPYIFTSIGYKITVFIVHLNPFSQLNRIPIKHTPQN